MKRIVLSKQAFDDLKYWLQIDTKFIKKIFELLDSITSDPFKGIGKPEPLKGYWSRRINDEHRLVYTITNEDIIIISCRSHYKF
jgi:toxin YoeB